MNFFLCGRLIIVIFKLNPISCKRYHKILNIKTSFFFDNFFTTYANMRNVLNIKKWNYLQEDIYGK